MNPAKRSSIANYEGLLADVVDDIADARRAAARVVNAVWPRVLEEKSLANEGVLSRLAAARDNACKVSFVSDNRKAGRIVQTLSAQLAGALAKEGAAQFPLPWSHR